MKNQKGVEESGKERAGEVVEDRYAPRQLDWTGSLLLEAVVKTRQSLQGALKWGKPTIDTQRLGASRRGDAKPRGTAENWALQSIERLLWSFDNESNSGCRQSLGLARSAPRLIISAQQRCEIIGQLLTWLHTVGAQQTVPFYFFSLQKIPFSLYKSTQIQLHYEKQNFGSASSAFASFGSNSQWAILDNRPFVMSQIKRWFVLNSSHTHSVSLEERQKKHRAQFVQPSATFRAAEYDWEKSKGFDASLSRGVRI